MARKMTMGEVNELDRAEFAAKFAAVFESAFWVAREAWEARPFGNFSGLHGAMVNAMYGAPRERRVKLIQAHPDLAGKAAMAGELTSESTREQASAGLDQLSPEQYESFTRMNTEYREKFDMPMIVCVREHSRESILKNAELRLGNTREEETETALAEISKIARLRLEDLVEGGERR